jgi:hypothetical protein
MNYPLFKTAIISGLVISFIAFASCAQTDPQVFDQAKWKKAAPGPGISIRMPMVQDLIKNYGIKGLTRQEIVQLLGEPMPYEDIPIDQNWYLIQEAFHSNGTSQGEEPYLQVHLVIKFDEKTQKAIELGFFKTENDLQHKKGVRSSYQKISF